jgi:hypothetical protein
MLVQMKTKNYDEIHLKNEFIFLDLELRIFQSLSFLIFNQFSGINGIF